MASRSTLRTSCRIGSPSRRPALTQWSQLTNIPNVNIRFLNLLLASVWTNVPQIVVGPATWRGNSRRSIPRYICTRWLWWQQLPEDRRHRDRAQK
jgi:hypothetical protein